MGMRKLRLIRIMGLRDNGIAGLRSGQGSGMRYEFRVWGSKKYGRKAVKNLLYYEGSFGTCSLDQRI